MSSLSAPGELAMDMKEADGAEASPARVPSEGQTKQTVILSS